MTIVLESKGVDVMTVNPTALNAGVTEHVTRLGLSVAVLPDATCGSTSSLHFDTLDLYPAAFIALHIR